MALLHQIVHTARIQDLHFAELPGKEVLLVAAEDKRVSVYTVPTDSEPTVDGEASKQEYNLTAEFVGHDSRWVVVNDFCVGFTHAAAFGQSESSLDAPDRPSFG